LGMERELDRADTLLVGGLDLQAALHHGLA
jgi:hypothetical protein